MKTQRCIIMGAAGRDFHDFSTFFVQHPEFRVVAFTAHQIPFIEQRSFPKSLAPGYDDDIPIYAEARLEALIEEEKIDFVFLSYSDLAHEDVMHKASRVLAAGASFALLGAKHTELRSRRPVVAVTAVRTGAGKSPLSQALAAHLKADGHRVGVVRHPMPYGDLEKQAVQRFATLADLDQHDCTVEEREEYAPYVAQGMPIYAGVDYPRILRHAEEDSDVILWDGGNNDTPFVVPGLHITVLDALRPGHEMSYHPGEVNLRRADILVINKVSQARRDDVEAMRRRIADINSKALIIESDLEVTMDHPERVRGRRVLVVEDGPTLTHGGMTFGAGLLAARQHGVETVVDPRPVAIGSMAACYEKYPDLGPILPALGYSETQRRDLVETIHASEAEVVVDASPAGLDKILDLSVPVVRVAYRFRQVSGPPLLRRVTQFVRHAVTRR